VVVSIILQDFAASQPHMCAGLTNRTSTVTAVAAEVTAKGVDGVNLDYEGLNATCPNGLTTRAMMTDFAHRMQNAMAASAYLSVDTYAGAAADPGGFFNVAGLNAYVDSFFVMAYDLEYSNYSSAPTYCTRFCLGPTSPLTSYYYNDTDVMAQYSAAVTPAKVILGVPYYGRKACVGNATTEYQHPIGVVTSDTYMDAAGEATDPAVRPGSYVPHRDAKDPAGKERWDTWYSTTLGCTRQLFWDDAVSLGYKYDLANRAGLRGVGIWTLNYGGGAKELWSALANHFGGWRASYDMSKVPTSWVAGQRQTFPVTVTNSGGATWPSAGHTRVDLDLHFATVAGGSAKAAYWLSSRTFPLPADVPGGASVTVRWSRVVGVGLTAFEVGASGLEEGWEATLRGDLTVAFGRDLAREQGHVVLVLTDLAGIGHVGGILGLRELLGELVLLRPRVLRDGEALAPFRVESDDLVDRRLLPLQLSRAFDSLRMLADQLKWKHGLKPCGAAGRR